MGTVTTWLASGGDETLTLTSLDTLDGRIGDQFDALGVALTPKIFAWRMESKMATDPVPGQTIQIYAAFARSGDATEINGDFGQVDAAILEADINAGALNNLAHIGNVIMDDDAAAKVMRGSGRFVCYERFFSPVMFNGTADVLSSTAGDHSFEIEDITSEI